MYIYLVPTFNHYVINGKGSLYIANSLVVQHYRCLLTYTTGRSSLSKTGMSLKLLRKTHSCLSYSTTRYVLVNNCEKMAEYHHCVLLFLQLKDNYITDIGTTAGLDMPTVSSSECLNEQLMFTAPILCTLRCHRCFIMSSRVVKTSVMKKPLRKWCR